MNRAHVEKVLENTAPALLGYFLRRTTNPEDAADLVSETLTEAWRVCRRMPSESEAARMWVFGVARNTLRHHVRGNLRRDVLLINLGNVLRHASGEVNDDDLDLRTAVEELPGNLPELIRLVNWDGFTLEQAATHLGIPASTIRSRYARAKSLLRAALTTSAEPVR
jgi:RNA polymerase sigma-70 factor (ECF subfamily)